MKNGFHSYISYEMWGEKFIQKTKFHMKKCLYEIKESKAEHMSNEKYFSQKYCFYLAFFPPECLSMLSMLGTSLWEPINMPWQKDTDNCIE